MDTNKLGVVEFLYKDEVACYYEYIMTCFYEGVVKFFDMNNKDAFMFIFYFPTPFNIFLSKPWVVNFYFTMVI